MSVQSGDGWFDQMLGDISYSADSIVGRLYPFFVRAGVVKRRSPRHPFFEYFLEMGLMDIERVLSGESIRGDSLSFVFPERWLAVHEQYEFMYKLSKHPDVKKIKQVDVITSSAMLISGFKKEQIRILTWPDDPEFKGGA